MKRYHTTSDLSSQYMSKASRRTSALKYPSIHSCFWLVPIL
ncbi:hypothetical protein KSS87_018625, partial [Heliosperma pusillum]